MRKFAIADITTIFEPRTTPNTTTTCAGFLVCYTLGANGTDGDGSGVGIWCGGRCIFAGPEALAPRMLKFAIADITTILEPRTSAETTTKFAGLLVHPTLRTFVLLTDCGDAGICCEPLGARFLRYKTPDVHHSAFLRWIALTNLPRPPRANALGARVNNRHWFC